MSWNVIFCLESVGSHGHWHIPLEITYGSDCEYDYVYLSSGGTFIINVSVNKNLQF